MLRKAAQVCLTGGLATSLLVLSHFGATSAGTPALRAGLRQAAGASVVLLAVTLVALAVYRALNPGSSRNSIRLGWLFAGITLSGLPWAYLSGIVALQLGGLEFMGIAQLGGLVGFLCWLKVLSESLR